MGLLRRLIGGAAELLRVYDERELAAVKGFLEGVLEGLAEAATERD